MTPADAAWDALFTALERLRAAWPDASWTYDRRLKCVASSIPLARADEARAAMAETLPTSWTEATLAAAPAPVKALADACGGLRASQLLGRRDDGLASHRAARCRSPQAALPPPPGCFWNSPSAGRRLKPGGLS